jgi:RND family efflux transporter MFP subunit
VLTQIRVRSGDHVKAGQLLMEIDPRQQMATVESARATERQKKALYDYNTIEIERQRKLFEAGVTSRDAYDQAQQSFDNSKADYESAVDLRKTQEEQLAYYTIRAPFDGVVGDIPVHVGDFVSPLNSPPTCADHGG